MPETRPKKCTEMKLASLPLQQEMAMDESTTAKQKCLSLSLNATMAAICEDDPHTFMLTLLPRCMCNLYTCTGLASATCWLLYISLRCVKAGSSNHDAGNGLLLEKHGVDTIYVLECDCRNQ